MTGIMKSHTPNGFGMITDRATELANDRSRASMRSNFFLRLAAKILLSYLNPSTDLAKLSLK